MPDQQATEIIPYLFYEDVPASLEWLARVFGFLETMRHATPTGMHAQMELDGCCIMIGSARTEWALRTPAAMGAATQGIFIYVPDVHAQHARALAQGAVAAEPPVDHGYGLTFTAHDPDGHPWYFTQRPD